MMEGTEWAWSIDSMLRNILIYGTSFHDPSENRGLFRSALIPSPRIPRDPGTEFGLVGSVGILGHKAVSKDSPIYPPSSKSATYLATPNPRGFAQEPLVYPDPIGPNSWMDSLFFGAGEFGQAIETWVDSNTLS